MSDLALVRRMSHFWISVILFGFKGSNSSSSLFHFLSWDTRAKKPHYNWNKLLGAFETSLQRAAQSDEVLTSLIDLLFSHVVSDHWTGQNNNPSLSDTSVHEVRVSVQEVGLPISTTPPDQDSYEVFDQASKQHRLTQLDDQSGCTIVVDSKLEDTRALPLK